MSKQPERPARAWWLMPLLVVMAIIGVIYLVRLVVGLFVASIGVLAVLAIIVGGLVLFTRSKT